MDRKTSKKIEELRFLEQHLQGLLIQKQAIQAELNEISNALDELNGCDDEVYKILSGMMIKSTKTELKKGLESKKGVLNMKEESFTEQENMLEKKIDDIRKDIESSVPEEHKKAKTK